MNERLAKVIEFEERLLQDRRQLQRLIAESDGKDPLIIKNKLEYFSHELGYMSRQAELLKSEVQQAQMQMHAQPQMYQQPQTVVQPQVAESVQQAPLQPQASQQVVPPPPQMVQDISRVQPAPKGDWEKTIGKSLMGIFASVLIFISLILFATLLLPYFNDTAKMITTYVVSFAFIAVGLWKLQKNKTNAFYLALTACGVGALYISLLLSNLYFKAIGDIALYVLIVVWGVMVCVISRLQTKLFQIIGHLGITISVIFGCILCVATEDEIKFTVLLVFYFVTSTMFFVAHYHREILKNIIFHVFNTFNYLVLVIVGCLFGIGGFMVPPIVLLVLLAVNIGLLLWSKTEEYGISFGIICSFFVLESWAVLEVLLEGEFAPVILFAIAMLLLVGIEFKKIEGDAGKYILQGVLLYMAGSTLQGNDFFAQYWYVPLLVLPVVLLGYFCQNIFCRYASLLLMFFYLFAGVENDIAHLLLAGVAIAGSYVLMWIKKEQYQTVYKYLLHTVAILFLLVPFTEVLHEILRAMDISNRRGEIVFAIGYTAIAAFNLIMLKSRMGTNLMTGEKDDPVYHNIVNTIVMLAGTFGIAFANHYLGWHLLIILVTIAVFTVNAKNILDNRENLFGGMYVGFKFTILMIVILSSFEAVNYVISIACFIFAIISIMLGFKFRYKALRIFGLILSMISTFKLIMVDITYENTLGNALSFFVSGILCFVISLIYNFIDGRINKKK